jgi:SEC-C motif-containing protein
MKKRFATKEGVLTTPLEYEPLAGTLELKCRACGKVGDYPVGRVWINPSKMCKDFDKILVEEAVFFSGYFHCSECGRGGPWELTQCSEIRLGVLFMIEVDKPGESGIQFGEMRLFDGTPSHSAAEGEAHLRRLIEADPQNYFLWSRLGNLFMAAEVPDRAFAAFQKAIQLNPLDVESHHSLAEIHKAKGERDQAAEHYHQILLHAREAPPKTKEKPALLRKMVRHTLESLLELRDETNGRIELYPNLPPEKRDDKDMKEAVVVFKSYDLGKEEDWDKWTESFLGELPASESDEEHRARKPVPAYRYPEQDRELRVGRNDPCPCGSGKKFKKCCGR